MTDRYGQFADQLQHAVDEIDVAEAVRFLKVLPIDHNGTEKYFIAMDVIRQFGSVELSIDLLKDVAKVISQLLTNSTNQQLALLPEYPGIKGVNIFHILAFYTQTHTQNSEAFFAAVRNIPGLASQANLRAVAFGLTPLQIAAEFNNRPIVEFIVARDESQVVLESPDGFTAGDLALQAGNTSIGKFLKDKEQSLIRKRQLTRARESLTSDEAEEIPKLSGVQTMLNLLAGSKRKPADPRLADLSSDESLDKRLRLCDEDSVVSRTNSIDEANSGVVNLANSNEGDVVANPGVVDIANSIDGANSGVVDIANSNDEAVKGTNPNAILAKISSRATDPRLNSREYVATDVFSSVASSNESDSTLIEDDPDKKEMDQESIYLGNYVRNKCRKLPQGDVMANMYVEFLTRMGITRLDHFRQSMKYSVFSNKFPSFMHE